VSFDGAIMTKAELENNETLEAVVIDADEPEIVQDETKAVPEDDSGEDDSDDVIVSIDGETPPQEEETRAPEWVRELRKSNREKERKIRELEAKLTTAATETKPVALGDKPSLEECDYDAELYESKLSSWYDRKRISDEAEAKAREAQQAEANAWQEKLASYNKAKATLKVRDYEDSEAVAQDNLTITQQGIIIQGSDNPALIIYALGKNTKRAKELASITDPVKFAFAVAKLETQLKVTTRKASTAPERTIANGGARLSGTVDSTLERLRDEAAKTGDLSKVMAYKRSKKAT
jgi:hypothetical protein